MIKKISIPLLHIGYWFMYTLLLLVLFLFLAINTAHHQQPFRPLLGWWLKIMIGFAYAPALVGFYYGYSVAFVRHLAPKLISKFILHALLVTLLSAVFGGLVMSLIFKSNILWYDGYHSAIPELLLMAFISGVNIVLGSVIRGFVQSTHDYQIKEQLEKERLHMELHLLRIQINPHFLFNTLSNIDALIQVDPDKASTYLHRLSQFMRQIVYQSEDAQYPLDSELLLLEDYIALQQLRTDETISVEWIKNGPTDEVYVPPLLLLPFIENCFKHGLLDQQHPLTIHLTVANNQFQIVFFNALSTAAAPDTGGLGLSLTRKRLMAVYGDRAQLFAAPTQSGFEQKILLPLQP